MMGLKTAFLVHFWNPVDNDLYDHIRADGTPSAEKRPNGVFAITVPLKDNPLLPADKAVMVLESMVKYGLIADHGVRTLSPVDPNYRKTHDETGQNHDYSYHNGDVWPWLSGHVIEAAVYVNKMDVALKLHQALLLRLLTSDTLGSIEEILDGTLPPSADPNLGTSRGAMSQAWSVAEFIRSVHNVWFGISPHFATERTLKLILRIPPFLNQVQVQTPLGEGTAKLKLARNSGSATGAGLKKEIDVEIDYKDMKDAFDIVLALPWIQGKEPIRPALILGKAEERRAPDWTKKESRGGLDWFETTVHVNLEDNSGVVKLSVPYEN